MNTVLLALIGSQLLFSTGDLMARHFMQRLGFHAATFTSLWFAAYVMLRTVATFAQLYVFTSFQLGKTMALFAAVNLVLANLLGYLFLGEVLPLVAYIGIMLAISSFFVVAYAKA